jgi:hypothetical protein
MIELDPLSWIILVSSCMANKGWPLSTKLEKVCDHINVTSRTSVNTEACFYANIGTIIKIVGFGQELHKTPEF